MNKRWWGAWVLSLAMIFAAGAAASAEDGAAPDIELQDLAGDMVRLSSFEGRSPVLLVFWTTWCPYCTRQIPNINQLEEAFGPDELAVLAVNSGQRRAQVLDHVRHTGIRYRVLLDPDQTAGEAYGVTGYPYMVLIDRDGRIIFTSYGVTQLLVDRIQDLTRQAREAENALQPGPDPGVR